MSKYLELSSDEMAELLVEFQTFARKVYETACAIPYSPKLHQKACQKYLDKGKWLAAQGDII